MGEYVTFKMMKVGPPLGLTAQTDDIHNYPIVTGIGPDLMLKNLLMF
jgi:hypothetical protein